MAEEGKRIQPWWLPDRYTSQNRRDKVVERDRKWLLVQLSVGWSLGSWGSISNWGIGCSIVVLIAVEKVYNVYFIYQ
jgi:hypothetical protein